MPKTATMTLRLSPDLRDKIGKLAEETDRTPSAVAQRGLSEYVDHQLWMIEEVERAREDFREGRTVPHDEAMARIDGIIARHKGGAA